MDVIRDPLYGPVPVDDVARRLIDTAAFQRLRRIRQLSEAFAVYPSAVHTRFEHSLGVYHLTREIIRRLDERGELGDVDDDQRRLATYAALLHDLGHHLGAHLLEEFGYPGVSHEDTGAALFTVGEVGEILRDTGIARAPEIVSEMVRHDGGHALGGLVSGACDADKLDYLARDAYHCGMPPGFDQAQLAGSLILATNPQSGAREIGIDADGLAAFEQMLVTKSTLYREVYFHPTVRCAMVMLRALIIRALELGLLALEELQTWTDEEVFTLLRVRVADTEDALVADLVERLLARRLYKRAASLPLSAAPALTPGQITEVEERLASRLGLSEGSLLLDIPRKPTMLSTDILVRCDDGSVVHAGDLGPNQGFALNELQSALYAASGRIGVFTSERMSIAPAIIESEIESVLNTSNNNR